MRDWRFWRDLLIVALASFMVVDYAIDGRLL